MRIRKVQGKDKFKLDMSGSEMRTLTIALANLNYVDFEEDLAEHNMSKSEASSNHLGLFSSFSEMTGMYPSKFIKNTIPEDVKPFVDSPPVGKEVF